MEIDHEDTHKDNNKLSNLKCCTHKANCNNPLTIQHYCEANRDALKGNTNAQGKPKSDFGIKFKEHYGITRYNNPELYDRELMWYHRHNHKCRWE